MNGGSVSKTHTAVGPIFEATDRYPGRSSQPEGMIDRTDIGPFLGLAVLRLERMGHFAVDDHLDSAKGHGALGGPSNPVFLFCLRLFESMPWRLAVHLNKQLRSSANEAAAGVKALQPGVVGETLRQVDVNPA